MGHVSVLFISMNVSMLSSSAVSLCWSLTHSGGLHSGAHLKLWNPHYCVWQGISVATGVPWCIHCSLKEVLLTVGTKTWQRLILTPDNMVSTQITFHWASLCCCESHVYRCFLYLWTTPFYFECIRLSHILSTWWWTLQLFLWHAFLFHFPWKVKRFYQKEMHKTHIVLYLPIHTNFVHVKS